MKHEIRRLLLDVAHGEVGPAVARRARDLLDGGPHRKKPPTKARIASVAHAYERRQQEKRKARDHRSGIREAIVRRSSRQCEACGSHRHPSLLEMDHFWGRAREESVESTWVLCPDCHRAKTENRPSRQSWLWAFMEHARRHEYREQIQKAAAVIQLERAQHPDTNDAAPR